MNIRKVKEKRSWENGIRWKMKIIITSIICYNNALDEKL